MSATSIDLSQIKTDALSAASTFRTLIGLGSSATLNAGSANGVATLGADSKLTAAQIPDISLISYLGSVASQAAMLALSGQQGDWCVRSDLSTTWVITGSDPTLLANWTQLSYPSVPVQSVFGRTGAVVGVSTDYSSVGITNTAIGATNPSTGAFTTLSATTSVTSPSLIASSSVLQLRSGSREVTVRPDVVNSSNVVKLTFGNDFNANVGGIGQFEVGAMKFAIHGYEQHGVHILHSNGIDYAPLRAASSTFYGNVSLNNSTTATRFDLYGTYSDGANYRRLYLDSTTAGAFKLGVEGAGTGSSGNTLELQTGGTSRLTIDASGNATFTGTVSVPGGAGLSSERIGGSSVASAYYSTAIGYGSSATGTGGVAVGYNSNSDSTRAIAIGYGATTRSADDVVIGGNVTTLYGQSVQVGGSSQTYARNVAIGLSATCAGVDSTALGFAASTSTYAYSIAVGSGATATAANQFQIGSSGGPVTQQRFHTNGGSLTFANETGTFLTVANAGAATFSGQLTNAIGTITASRPATFTQTWNSGGTTFTGILQNITDTASASGSLLMDLQVGGTTQFRVRKDGAVLTPRLTLYSNPRIEAVNVSTQTITYVGYAHSFRMGESEVPRVEVDPVSGLGIGIAAGGGMNNGAWLINDAANTLAQRNGTSAQTYRIYNTYTDASNWERAKIAWSSNVLQIGTEKLGTGSARALELQTDGTTRLTIGATGAFTIADALNVSVGTTTGTKIGTATTQKLGFYNSTPVVQPAAVADATDAASVITQLNLLLARMRDLGLIAT